MSPRRRCLTGRAPRTRRSRWLLGALLATSIVGGCSQPFEPFEHATEGPFSMFGYLDVAADTQWIRVVPVRQNLLADSAPVDAVVTLENLESGHKVMLADSLFEFADLRLKTVAYTHNFWTTETIERGAKYRLEAVRSDGATTTALVEMPVQADVVVSYYEGPPDVIGGDTIRFRKPLRIDVQGAYLLYSDAVHTVRDFAQTPPRDSVVVSQTPIRTSPGMYEFRHPDSVETRGLLDLRRVEMRVGVAPSDWPYVPGLSTSEAALPGRAPSNVENGFGFVGGVATWAIPLSRCDPEEPRPDSLPVCGHVVGASSAAVSGRVVGTCGRSRPLPTVYLTERLPGGGTAVFEWSANWKGSYEFEGLEPGADLVLQIVGAETMHLPSLASGQRYFVPDVSVPLGCSPGTASIPDG